MVGEVDKVTAETPKTPCKDVRAISKDAKMKVGCSMIMIMDQATSRVHRAPREASDGHNKIVEDAIESHMRKGKASRKYCPKVRKARWLATSDIKIPGMEICHSLLEEYIPPKYKELL